MGVGVGVALGGNAGVGVAVGLGGDAGSAGGTPGTGSMVGVGAGLTVDVGTQTSPVPDAGGSVTVSVTVPSTSPILPSLPITVTGDSHIGGQGSRSVDPGVGSDGTRLEGQVGASAAVSASLVRHVDATFAASVPGGVAQALPRIADGSLIPDVKMVDPTAVDEAAQVIALHETIANDVAMARLLTLSAVSESLAADGNADLNPATEMRLGDGFGLGAPDTAGAAIVVEGVDAGTDTGTLALEPGAGLVESSPIDLAALDQAVKQFLGQLADLRQELGSFVLAMGPYPWLLALALAGAAYELQRRRQRRAQAELILAAACEGAAAPWFPGLAGFTTLD